MVDILLFGNIIPIMDKAINKILSESALKILRPLLRIMLRNGVSCGSFEELVRKAYVDEAFSMSINSEQKTSISSISARTGLSRKEVKRLHELEKFQPEAVEQRYNRAIRVISGWLNEMDFTDAMGNPSVLALDGDEPSFAELTKRYSGDIPARAMLNLLITAGCVHVDNNQVKLVRDAYVPSRDSTEILRILGKDTNELINTIDYNLTVKEEQKRYQRKVSTAALNKKAINEFKNFSTKQSQAMLEKLDAWLSKNEVSPDDDNACYVSLGIYYYEQ